MICLLLSSYDRWNEDSTEKSVTAPTSCQYQRANQRFHESMIWIARVILTSSFNYLQAKGWCMFGYHQVERNIDTRHKYSKCEQLIPSNKIWTSLTLQTLFWLPSILPFNEPSIDVVVRVRHRMSKKTCNTYLPHPCFLKSFIFVVATVRPIISNPPRAVTSPPALSSMKNVRLFTRWNFTNFKSIGSELSCRSNDVSLMVCSGSTSSTSYTKVCIKK